MNEEKKCDLEVAAILKEQYQQDQVKTFLNKLVNKKRQANKNYNNLELLADVALYYKKITKTVKITNEVLDILLNKILELDNNDHCETNMLLNSVWKKVQDETTTKMLDIKQINELWNDPLLAISPLKQKFLPL